jgi:L-iditol 2-dehydrogenase
MDIPKTMKAAVLYGLEDVRIVERDVPVPEDEDVLIKVESCSICGGDVKIISRGIPHMPPFGEFIIGHEYSGIIVQKGKTVKEYEVGDRVTVEVHKGCDRCKNCRAGNYTTCLNYGNKEMGHRANGFTTNGGFAEYVVNHVNTLSKIPENISFDQATLVTTAGTPLFGFEKSGGFIPGLSVAVIGPGAIGLMAVQAAKALGAEKVILTGTRDDRLELGKKLGADYTVNVKNEDVRAKVLEYTDGIGADRTMIAAGSSVAMQTGLEITCRGGDVVLLAHFDDPISDVNIGLAVLKGMNIFTVRGEGSSTVHSALSLMKSGKIVADPLITHHFSLDDLNEGFRTFRERQGNALKVVIHP